MYVLHLAILFWNRLVLGAILLLLSLTSASAYAETENCTEVPSLPFTITTQGLWCLKHDLITAQTSGNAIEITANNVTLDLNGWKLGGQGAGPGTIAKGIFSIAVNITIKNGTVRGFNFGVHLGGRGSKVQNLLVDQSTERGIYVTGEGAIVRTNQIIDTGGSTRFADVQALGIWAAGIETLVESNVVAGLTAMGLEGEWGIFVGGNHSSVSNNFVTDSANPTGLSYGISAVGNPAHVDNNTVSNFKTCINVPSGIYTRNTVTSCSTFNYSGGIAGPGNAP